MTRTRKRTRGTRSRMSTKVFDVGHEIRDLVNDPRRRQRLMQNNALWSHLCVCMDVISDTESDDPQVPGPGHDGSRHPVSDHHAAR